jgi:small subunit ribosomal protein S15
MARMYSRRKGKSGSRKPVDKKAAWVKYKPKEIEQIILKLQKEGMKAAQIGIILRDQYGIPLVKPLMKKSISTILKDNKLNPEIPDDLMNLLKLAVDLHAHMAKNRRDYSSKRGLELAESKIRRLAKYYKRTRVLPPEWVYDPDRAKLIVK